MMLIVDGQCSCVPVCSLIATFTHGQTRKDLFLFWSVIGLARRSANMWCNGIFESLMMSSLTGLTFGLQHGA
jgi:hypothetical protein